MTATLPTYFIPHGGGPWPAVPELAAQHASLAEYLRTLLDDVGTTARAILIISAHWEARVATISSRSDFSMLYDYGGFPPETYRLQYPAPGSPEIAHRVVELLDAAGVQNATEHKRGYDHGVFVPLMVAAPEATIPVVPLSLITGLDPTAHLALGKALAPLRREGVLIIGAGMSTHNLQAMFSGADLSRATSFEAWLDKTVTGDVTQRDARLVDWASAPQARFAHPREEHLLPLMVVAGASEGSASLRTFYGEVFGSPISAFRFGSPIGA